eukprot:Amastigsp_a8494_19.p3 type:complete len:280 gc:universal Amastigsp_a8494_19:356-1195(+)
MRSSSALEKMFAAWARSCASVTSDSPTMRWAWARACASAVAVPVVSTARDSALSWMSSWRASSTRASSRMRWRASSAMASCSFFFAAFVALASRASVVIEIAIWTDCMSESRVDLSTGSTDWMSTALTTRWLLGNRNSVRRSPVAGSTPNTARLMISAEALWNASKETPATAPRTRDAMALHMSPTKSGMLKSSAPSAGELRSTSKNHPYERRRSRRAWSEVSTVRMSVEKSGPSWSTMSRIWPERLGLPPERLSTVSCSSGWSITMSGPKTTRAVFWR